jgi:general secretion pathway protein F
VLEGESAFPVAGRTGCFPPSCSTASPSAKAPATSNQLNVFTKVIASGVLMGVFIFVGFIAFAIVQAVFQVSSSFKMGG